jgi:hypothetical protein
MHKESNHFMRKILLSSSVEENTFIISRCKKDKTYFLFTNDGSIVLSCRYESNKYIIYDFENNKLAEIIVSGYINKKYYLYYNHLEYSQIIGIHQQNYNNGFFYIPHLTDGNNGVNTFKSLQHMDQLLSPAKKIILEWHKLVVPIKFTESVDSVKNSHYYNKDTLVFELAKCSKNKFNIYLKNPLSIVQGFMLALVKLNI